jgi:hypothetical protein
VNGRTFCKNSVRSTTAISHPMEKDMRVGAYCWIYTANPPGPSSQSYSIQMLLRLPDLKASAGYGKN